MVLSCIVVIRWCFVPEFVEVMLGSAFVVVMMLFVIPLGLVAWSFGGSDTW